MKQLLRVLLVLVGIAYLGLILLALSADRLIFQPHPASYTDAQLRSAKYAMEHLRLRSGSETISAVYLPNPNAQYTILYSHGNAEDIGDTLPLVEQFRTAGFAVFSYDYRGYGTSTGQPSEKGVYSDAHAAYDYLTQTLHVPPSSIISHGHSLGAAAAIYVASTRPVAGLIADAPFVSAFRVLTRIRLLPWDEFNNSAHIRRVHCPVLVIQGKADEVIPWWHGQRIYQLANQPKRALWIDNAGHNDTFQVAGKLYLQSMQDFATSLAPTQPSATVSSN